MIMGDCPCIQKAHRGDDIRLHSSENSAIDPILLDLLSLKSVSALGGVDKPLSHTNTRRP